MEHLLTGFDIEIATKLPDGKRDWTIYSPGVTCAVTMDHESVLKNRDPGVWYGTGKHGVTAAQMSPVEVRNLMDCIIDSAVGQTASRKIVTWNGLSFDFPVLLKEAGRYGDEIADTWKHIAIAHHIDLMYMVVSKAGHYLALDKALKGAGLEGKTPGVDGALAPEMWKEGKYAEVIEYCVQDVKQTLLLADWVNKNKKIAWTSGAGNLTGVQFPNGLLTVYECMSIRGPDEPLVDRTAAMRWMEEI